MRVRNSKNGDAFQNEVEIVCFAAKANEVITIFFSVGVAVFRISQHDIADVHLEILDDKLPRSRGARVTLCAQAQGLSVHLGCKSKRYTCARLIGAVTTAPRSER